MKPTQIVEQYLKRKAWEYRESAGQYVVKTCPFCGDRGNHFYINKTTSQFQCWKCGDTGNIYTLKKRLGDIAAIERIAKPRLKIKNSEYKKLVRKLVKWNKDLRSQSNKKVRKIIRDKWGFNNRVITRFKLGVEKRGKVNWLVVPQFENGKVAGVKYETLPPAKKRFRREEGMRSVLFNADRIDPTLSYVYLFEGESDAMTADALVGVRNALGVTVGARGFKDEWIDYLEKFEKIYIVYDNDIPGQKGAEKIAFRLGVDRCWNIVLPAKEVGYDFNDWYRDGNTLEDFDELTKNAEQFSVSDISPVRDVLDDLEAELYFNNRLDTQGFTTQWKEVNALLGSIVPGDLVVLSGQAKIGKTTFGLNLLLHHAMNGVPVLNYCLEMRPERIVPKIVSWLRGVPRDKITREDIIYTRTMFGRKPFYIGHSYSFTADQIYDTIRTSVIRFGIELLVFDHLHFLVRSVNQVAAEVGNTVRAFKLLAEELKIPIILICQPTKLKGNKRMTTEDLKDSSAIGQDADTVIILHRERMKQPDEVDSTSTAIFSPKTDVIVDATRYNPGGVSQLWYDGALSRFESYTKKRG